VNQRLGLLTISAVENYKDQQAWLREHLEQMPLDREYRKEMQQLLSEEGFYKGPIDGILGKRSTKAIDLYFRKVQELLHERGLYEKDVDGVLGEHSIEAVKQFQRATALKEDGVPVKKLSLHFQVNIMKPSFELRFDAECPDIGAFELLIQKSLELHQLTKDHTVECILEQAYKRCETTESVEPVVEIRLAWLKTICLELILELSQAKNRQKFDRQFRLCLTTITLIPCPSAPASPGRCASFGSAAPMRRKM
jgi:peptidoglycan hydrolase-like protein with peptidoglycan-binding domain